MSVSGLTTKQRSIAMGEKGISELLEELEFNAAFINTKVVNAIEETENLLRHILKVLGKQQ
jgi:hypothetical protein